jgi:hypothetical protein
MRLIRVVCFFVAVTGTLLLAQTPTVTPPPPQSARQALLEMFLGKGESDFTKHLPETANQALIHKGDSPETNVILKISTIGRQMTAQGEHLESFETGPNLLVSEQNNGHEKYEIAVEHDTLLGEDDEIELSVHYYKDGQLQSLPVVPRVRSRPRYTRRSPIPTISRDCAKIKMNPTRRPRRTGLPSCPWPKETMQAGILIAAMPAR